MGSLDTPRVLIQIPGNKLFGQERALLLVGTVLRARGLAVEILTHGGWGANVSQAARDLDFEVHELPLGTIWSPRLLATHPRSALSNLTALRRTKKFLNDRIGADDRIICILGNAHFGLYLLPLLRRRNTCGVYRHGDEPWRSAVFGTRLTQLVFRECVVHVPNCQFLASKVEPLIEASARLEIIRNIPFRPIVPPKPRIAACPRHLVYVGQLAHHKGVPLLIDAFDRLANEFPDLSLSIAGLPAGVEDGRDAVLEKVLALTRRFPHRVRYLGYLEDLDGILADGAIHVCPSVWPDPSPNVIVEAKARSVPSIGFEVGGIPELIRHGQDGIICGEPSLESLVSGVRRMVDGTHDYSAMCTAAQDYSTQNYSRERFGESWATTISAAAEEKWTTTTSMALGS